MILPKFALLSAVVGALRFTQLTTLKISQRNWRARAAPIGNVREIARSFWNREGFTIVFGSSVLSVPRSG